MPRYIDADLLIETMQKRYDEICDTYGHHDLYASGYDDAVDAVDNSPAADVAPRAEVAREIFGEIEKLHLHITNEFDLSRYEELKKKYTEGQK